MADKFILSPGLTHELDMAFRRNGWIAIDVKRLCAGTVLEEVLRFLGPTPGDVSQEALSKLKDTPIPAIFTDEQALELGFPTNLNKLFLNFGLWAVGEKFGFDAYRFDPVRCGTIGQLVQLVPKDLMRQPNVKNRVIEYVEAVLALHSLRLGMIVH